MTIDDAGTQTYAIVTYDSTYQRRHGRFSFSPGEAAELARAMRFYADAIDPPAPSKGQPA